MFFVDLPTPHGGFQVTVGLTYKNQLDHPLEGLVLAIAEVAVAIDGVVEAVKAELQGFGWICDRASGDEADLGGGSAEVQGSQDIG